MKTTIRLILSGAFLPLSLSHARITVTGDRATIETKTGSVIVRRGAVIRLENRLTGEVYTAAEAAGPGLGIRMKTGERWAGANARIRTTRLDPDKLRIEAALPDGSTIATTYSIEPKTGDILVRQWATSAQNGLYGVQWQIPGIDLDQDILVPGQSGMNLGRASPLQGVTFNWPVGWEVRMMVVARGKGGVWIWTEDPEMRFKACIWKRAGKTGALTFRTDNFAPIDKLTAAESVEWRLAFFEGDWRVPARRYRERSRVAWKRTRLADQQPAWVEDIRFVVITGLKTEVIDALAKQVDPAATLLYIPQWRKDGYDRNYPDYTALDAFEPFVRHARGLGYHVMPHMNYFGCDPEHPAYQRHKTHHLRDPLTNQPAWWIPPLERLPGAEPSIKFAYINPASKAWRDELTERMVAAQKEYGFDAIHLDQTLLMINHAGGLIDGMSSIQGNLALHRQLRQAMPGVALSGEGLNEVTGLYEAFAQRHAPHAVDHVHATWNEQAIASAHPISSYFLTPYTRIYGYLGMCNPSNRGLFLAWRRSYENWGVVPTFARPTVSQVEALAGLVPGLLAEANLWVNDRLEPDYASDWGPDTKFRLRGPGGVTARYERRGPGSALVRRSGNSEKTIYEIIKGKNTVRRKGTIPDWYAFDEETLFGLHPEVAYIYSAEPRDPTVPHLRRLSLPGLVGVLALDRRKFVLTLDDLPATATYDFITRAASAETGIVVAGTERPLGEGGSFRADMGTCNNVRRPILFAHPPWRVPRNPGPEPVRTFGRYRVSLPAGAKPVLDFGIGLRDGVNGRSDGARFRVEVDGRTLFDEIWDKSEWRDASISLAEWAGQTVTITFITTPGPRRDRSFDWACWAEPRIRYERAARSVEAEFLSAEPVRNVVGSDPDLTWEPAGTSDGMHLYRVRGTMPGRFAFLWSEARTVRLPLDLAATEFEVAISARNTPVAVAPRFVGAAPANGISAGEKRPGIRAHPPDEGRTSVDYLIQLPDRKPLTLEFAVGVRDGSKTEGIAFIVEVNTKEMYRLRLRRPDGWHPGTVDLSAFAGKPILLSLVVDAEGSYRYDWATWADPIIR